MSKLHPNHPKFSALIGQRKRDGLCCCWDCLRSDGITPPRGYRTTYNRLYPHTVFEKDPGGEPFGKSRKTEKPDQVTESGKQLREAVANRSVI